MRSESLARPEPRAPGRGGRPVFLDRGAYRHRRLMDALRLLPVLGLALWMVPLIWPVPSAEPEAQAIPMSVALRYVFGVWTLLSLSALALWWRTRTRDEEAAAPGDAG